MDHDQFLKHLVHLFPADWVALALPDLPARLDFTRLEWIEQEVFADPPHGERLRVDVALKVPTLPSTPPHDHEPDGSIVLLHLELEANMTIAQFDPRMYRYYKVLREQFGLSVLPIAVFLHTPLDGRGVRQYAERVWDYQPLAFTYHYLALPGLPAEPYLRDTNLLNVALSCMMDMPRERRVHAAYEALATIDRSDLTIPQKYALLDFVQTYSPLDETQQRDLDALLTDPKQERAMPFRKRWSERVHEEAFHQGEQTGLQAGLQTGLQTGQQTIVRELVIAKFPNAQPERIAAKLGELPPEQLRQLAVRLLAATSLQELGLDD
jgi:hypothetical protein